ncbi:hypothetical protein K7432_007370 [Basidiobolus ranarum]|uniref:Uncharacterized protein n=1 Tax=Basidiobolus ranarum TaxID=34480 RepID=A0ABR2WTF2_9FUNG
METFSLERVITLGERKLTDIYDSSRDLGIGKEVILKGFLKRTREINELQKQLPFNIYPSKEIFDNFLCEDTLVRSPIEAAYNGNVSNEFMFNMLNTFMYPPTCMVDSEHTLYSPTDASSTSSSESIEYPMASWSTGATSELSFNLPAGPEGYIPELISTSISQTTLSSDSLNYVFEQPYYNYLSASLTSESMDRENCCQSESIPQRVEDNSTENPPPFYSELSKALLLNDPTPEAQSLVGGDKRKRCYEEADVEAQLIQSKRVATV